MTNKIQIHKFNFVLLVLKHYSKSSVKWLVILYIYISEINIS